MRFIAHKIVLVTLMVATFASPDSIAAKSKIKTKQSVSILWLPLTRPVSLHVIEEKLSDNFTVSTVTAPTPEKEEHPNPFKTVKRDFWIDHYLPQAKEEQGPLPILEPSDADWFAKLYESNSRPKIFITGGHNVISEGFHNDSETHFMFMPTLIDAIKRYPKQVAPVFANVRLAILFACNTLTNLEPHGANGEALTPQEIAATYSSSENGKVSVVGSEHINNTLEFYRARLAREYGPHSPKYEYTRDPKEERCYGPGKYENCDITNVDRILPDSGMWDGSHRYNNSHLMKQLFPNAYLVIGFNSASDSEELRALALREAIENGDKELKEVFAEKRVNKKIQSSILSFIVNEATPEILRKKAIEILRKNWTLSSFKHNRGRAGGSITPAYPDLDKNGIFNIQIDGAVTPSYLPYEVR